MTLDEYQNKALETSKIDWNDTRQRHIPTFGIIGELGSVTSELKKALRDGNAYTESDRNLTEEFGDLLWYLAVIANRYSLRLQELARVDASSQQGETAFDHIYTMISASAHIAVAVDAHEALRTGVSRARLVRALSAGVRRTLFAIEREHLSLEKVLKANLTKVRGMFGAGRGSARYFDREYPEYERLPRKLSIHFLERRRSADRAEVVVRTNEMNVGDRITDNAKKDDGYRFHDAFHLGYAAVLGWSPVVRATFRRKRKSNPTVDETQDGARAAIIEEAIAVTVFNYARGHSMLKGLDRVDHSLLKLIQRMVRGLEVEACAPHEWQRAILVGFNAFRALRKNKGGWLLLDADHQDLTYSAREPEIG